MQRFSMQILASRKMMELVAIDERGWGWKGREEGLSGCFLVLRLLGENAVPHSIGADISQAVTFPLLYLPSWR